MIKKEYVDTIMKHKHALIFAGGIATAIVGNKILESDVVKESCTKGMAAVLAAKKDAEECYQDMRENAEDICSWRKLWSQKRNLRWRKHRIIIFKKKKYELHWLVGYLLEI